MRIEEYIKNLPFMFCKIKEIEEKLASSGTDKEGAKMIKYTVENYTELLTITDQEVNDFAFVKNSQGTSWLPGTIGGDYYGKGLYIWTGTVWAEANIEINTALDSLFEEHKEEFDPRRQQVWYNRKQPFISNNDISMLDLNDLDFEWGKAFNTTLKYIALFNGANASRSTRHNQITWLKRE